MDILKHLTAGVVLMLKSVVSHLFLNVLLSAWGALNGAVLQAERLGEGADVVQLLGDRGAGGGLAHRGGVEPHLDQVTVQGRLVEARAFDATGRELGILRRWIPVPEGGWP